MVVHWDGKTLTLGGNVKSARVCVGVDEEQTRNLLGIPEAEPGRGEAEFEVVKEHYSEMGGEGQNCWNGL